MQTKLEHPTQISCLIFKKGLVDTLKYTKNIKSKIILDKIMTNRWINVVLYHTDTNIFLLLIRSKKSQLSIKFLCKGIPLEGNCCSKQIDVTLVKSKIYDQKFGITHSLTKQLIYNYMIRLGSYKKRSNSIYITISIFVFCLCQTSNSNHLSNIVHIYFSRGIFCIIYKTIQNRT